MSYTAKTWRTLDDFKVNDLNSLERGVQEAHEGVDLLRKDFTTTKIAQDKAISQINSLLNQSGSALQAIKDIENILVSDKELSEVLKNYGTEFLSKEPQSLSNDELKNVYKNLKLNEYKLFTSVTINGKEVIGNSLDIKSPELDTILNRSSNNAVTNAAITQALENFSSPDINRYLNIHNESTTSHDDIRVAINSKASIEYVNDAIKNIPVPDVSKQISEHNSDATSHQDIRDMLNNLDLSGYAKEDHIHDDYLPLTAGSSKKLTGVLATAGGPGKIWDTSSGVKFGDSSYISGDSTSLGLQSADGVYFRVAGVTRSVINSTLLRPSTTETMGLGSSNYKWKEIHGTTIYQNGKQVADKDHTHDYAASDHTHNYATQSDIDNAIANIKLPEIDFDGLATEDFVSEAIKDLTSTSYVDGSVSNHAKDGNAHSDIRTSVTNIQASVNTINGLLNSFAKSDDIVKKSGDTMTGTLTLGNITLNPSTNTISTNKLTLTNLSESSSASKLVVLDSSNNAQYRSLTGLKSDLNITNDINTAVQGVKDWLLGTGNANTIDTIKDIADIMEEHKDVLDTLGNTYALKGHNHEGVYAPVHDHPYASSTHNHDSVYAKLSGGNTFEGIQRIKGSAASKPLWVRGIVGCETASPTTLSDLYLNYETDFPVHFGKSGTGTLNSDGTITEAGTLLSNKYAAKSHSHTDYAASSHTHAITELKNSAGNTFTSTKTLSSKSHSGWTNNTTDDRILPTMSFMAYWNGAYSSSGSSNLAYCNQGAFGSIVTKSTSDYATSGHTHDYSSTYAAKSHTHTEYAASGHTHNYAGSSSAGGAANTANSLTGFANMTTSQGWGNQTGTFIWGVNDSTGGSLAFRRDNPNGGQMSMVIDGAVYVDEGNKRLTSVLTGTSSTKDSNTGSTAVLRIGYASGNLYIWNS